MEHILNDTQENTDFIKQNQANAKREQAKTRKDCKKNIFNGQLKSNSDLAI